MVGCQRSALELGQGLDTESAAVSIVWLGELFAGHDGIFAVGWLSPEGYQIRLTTGSESEENRSSHNLRPDTGRKAR